jgi:DNA-binding MarR family transcriptional regulator
MSELEAGEPISQREIAGRLGIAVGLVNSYLKTLVHKGFVQVKAYPRNRYAYLLTTQGLIEKSRLAFDQLTYYHKLFRMTRQDSLDLFHQIYGQGVRKVSFCGIDEFTEIAYLSLREAQIELLSVMDDRKAGERFIDQSVLPLTIAPELEGAHIVITSLREPERYIDALLQLGVRAELIHKPMLGVV